MKSSRLAIRMARYGCTNRPFFWIIVTNRYAPRDTKFIEQLGSYDPLPNIHNEKLVALNFERIRYWMGQGAEPVKSVQKLLGLSGFLPIHPMSIVNAKRRREKLAEEQKSAESEIPETESNTA